jgi:ribosomal protein S18 acetylase RimI-like enzyme
MAILENEQPSFNESPYAERCDAFVQRIDSGVLVRSQDLSETCLWPFLAMAAQEADNNCARRDPYLRRFLTEWPRSDDFGFVAQIDGVHVGAIWARTFTSSKIPALLVDDRTAELVIAVVPEMRGKGIGGLLLRALVREATNRKFSGLYLTVREGNPAIHLYRRMQFEVVATGLNRVGSRSMGMLRSLTSS